MIVLFTIALIAVAAVIEGYVLKVLWAWFFVPLGAPAITIPIAIGIAMTVGMLTHQHGGMDDDDWAPKVAGAIAGPPLILLCGWIAHGFM